MSNKSVLGKSGGHQSGLGDVDHGLRRACRAFVVLAEPSAVLQPGEGPFDYPAPRKNPEALDLVVSFDDLQFDPTMSPDLGYPFDQHSSTAAVGPDGTDPSVLALELS